jgi:hypothetical protein
MSGEEIIIPITSDSAAPCTGVTSLFLTKDLVTCSCLVKETQDGFAWDGYHSSARKAFRYEITVVDHFSRPFSPGLLGWFVTEFWR